VNLVPGPPTGETPATSSWRKRTTTAAWPPRPPTPWPRSKTALLSRLCSTFDNGTYVDNSIFTYICHIYSRLANVRISHLYFMTPRFGELLYAYNKNMEIHQILVLIRRRGLACVALITDFLLMVLLTLCQDSTRIKKRFARYFRNVLTSSRLNILHPYCAHY
jgi:hypothetical protein